MEVEDSLLEYVKINSAMEIGGVNSANFGNRRTLRLRLSKVRNRSASTETYIAF
jgi:hypothetical protein